MLHNCFLFKFDYVLQNTAIEMGTHTSAGVGVRYLLKPPGEVLVDWCSGGGAIPNLATLSQGQPQKRYARTIARSL